jgi:hypothetical protein
VSSPARFCYRCGHELQPDVRFCTACGHQAEPPRADPGQPSGYGAVPTAVDFTIPPRRSRRPLLVALVAVIVIGAGTGIAIAAMPSHKTPGSDAAGNTANHTSHSPAVSASATSKPTSAPPPSPPPQEQAAQALANLLAQSGSDRAKVLGAVSAVESCSGSLSRDETVFRNAASSRQTLLTKLSDLPHRSKLPARMLADLTAGWQASITADQDFATWVQDEISQGCSTHSQANPAFKDAGVPDTQATTDKKAFVRQWNPIAARYSLPKYQYSQI